MPGRRAPIRLVWARGGDRSMAASVRHHWQEHPVYACLMLRIGQPDFLVEIFCVSRHSRAALSCVASSRPMASHPSRASIVSSLRSADACALCLPSRGSASQPIPAALRFGVPTRPPNRLRLIGQHTMLFSRHALCLPPARSTCSTQWRSPRGVCPAHLWS